MLQVVLFQYDMVWEDKLANHALVRDLAHRAAPEPGSLLVLPELFDTGFSTRLEATRPGPAGESAAFLGELARETHCAVLGGVVGACDSDAETCSNQALAFDPGGRELVRYAKRQAFTPMREHEAYQMGDAWEAFRWQDVQIAPLICYDLRFPELFRPAARAGAELFVVIANWPAKRTLHWLRLLQARAIENQAFVVGVNRCGSDPFAPYEGRSAAFDPQGVPVVEASDKTEVCKLTIDPHQVRAWRRAFPALRDARFV